MCMFRLKHNGEYVCGKRYPLKCSPTICPFGRELHRILVKTDFKAEAFWLMPGRHLVSLEEAIEALQSGEADYVVKSFSIGVARNGKGKH